VGTLFPDAQERPKYAQLYFYDPDEALDWQMNRNAKLDREIMGSLQEMLLDCNQYSTMFLHALEILERIPSRDLGLHILADLSTDLRRYNAPSIDEIAVLLPGSEEHSVNPRDIVLHSHDGQLQFIHDHHKAYTALHYVLLFPLGTDGWTYGIKHHQVNTLHVKNVTQVQFYGYRLHI
jgi:hypothetical protein